MDPFTIMAIAGMGLQVYGMISGANAEADAAEADAESKRLQADEVIRRNRDMETDIRREGVKLHGQQVSAYAKSGVDMGGSPLLALEDTQYGIERELQQRRQEAAFSAKQLRSGASISNALASDKRTAGWIGAGATVLTSTKSVRGLFDANDGTTKRF